jgi:hypothetical protein
MRYCLLAVFLFFTTNCGDSLPSPQEEKEILFPNIEALDEGLTILKATPKEELRAAFRQTDHVVYSQCFRGEDLILGKNTQDQDAPAYSVNCRFVDMDGTSFIMGYNGHDERIVLWDTRVNGLPNYDGTKRDLDMQLAYIMATELDHDISLQNKFEVEIETLLRRSYTATLTPRQIGQITGENIVIANPTHSQSTEKSSRQYEYWMMIRKKDAFGMGFAGDHSALWLRVYDPTGRLIRDAASSNHGTAADNLALMQYHCNKMISLPHGNRYFDYWPCDFDNYGIWYGKHVCNDDTYVQYRQIREGYKDTRTCYNWPMRRAPSCY